jgi:hypothetical protein
MPEVIHLLRGVGVFIWLLCFALEEVDMDPSLWLINTKQLQTGFIDKYYVMVTDVSLKYLRCRILHNANMDDAALHKGINKKPSSNNENGLSVSLLTCL